MKNNYIIIGDSIAYVIGDYEFVGWISLFKKKLLQADNMKECSNYAHLAGFPWATSKDISTKIDSIINTYRLTETNNIVIISIGINDSQMYKNETKVALYEYTENIKYIINAINKYNCDAIFLGLTRINSINNLLNWKPNKYYDNKYISMITN